MKTSRPVITALLPMKANSERVKGKNFRMFIDRPLFRWVLDTLLSSPLISNIVINTDAERILRASGIPDSPRVIIRQRKQELCGDLISMNKILEDDLSNSESDIYLMTHTTNPLLSRSTIEGAIAAFTKASAAELNDSLFSVDRIQTRFYRADGSAVNHDPDLLIRTQDLEPWFEENSNLYLFTKDSFARTGARIGATPLLFESPRFESIDIDDEADWEFALVAAEYLKRGQ